MNEGLAYVVGGLGAILAVFGLFLLLHERYDQRVGGFTLLPGTRRVAKTLLLVGTALFVFALILPTGSASGEPQSLLK